MADQESFGQAYFKGLRLGDFIRNRPRLRVNHTAPDFAPTISARKAKAKASGPSAWWRVEVVVGFKRGFRGDVESPDQFWDRVQQFGVDLIDRLAPQTGHSQAGPLSFMRDPAGAWHGQDQVQTTEIINVGAPQFTVDTDVEAEGWTTGQSVLLLDPGNASTFDWQIAELDQLQGDGVSLVSTTIQMSDTTELLRLSRYFPEVALLEAVDLEANGPAADKFVKEVRLAFGGVTDPVGGRPLRMSFEEITDKKLKIRHATGSGGRVTVIQDGSTPDADITGPEDLQIDRRLDSAHLHSAIGCGAALGIPQIAPGARRLDATGR